MCGIAAIFKSSGKDLSSIYLTQMRELVAHRGPDAADSVVLGKNGRVCLEEQDWNIGLAHRRLSILDLSEAGGQPMVYREKYWIVYNGEVYNYVELRRELEIKGYQFRSNSDTEVILASYAEWGTECFARFRGMWGIVIVDMLHNCAILSRDRFGIKPLYIHRQDELVAVVSEIKQILCLPSFQPRLDESAAREFLFTGYEDPSRTFFEAVHPVPAGTFQSIDLDTLQISKVESYWHPEQMRPAVTNVFEAAHRFREKLIESVALHLRSDVPVGCALSGGLDSSALAVLIDRQKEAGKPTQTFTIVFPGESIDERNFAEEVVRSIHAQPHFVHLDPVRFSEEWPNFVWAHDEPVGSLSIYAGYSIARATREAGVPVTLNGQGGDEILSGYWQSYFVHLRNLGASGKWLGLLDHFGGAILPGGNRSLWAEVPGMCQRYLSRVRKGPSGSSVPENIVRRFLALDPQAQRVFQLRTLFLPRLLKWDDRNSMSFGVEGRYPFLDHEISELALSFSPDILYSRGWTKWPMREALKQDLPPAIARRRSKFGFETPQAKWLCGPLRPLIEKWFSGDSAVWAFVDRDQLHEGFSKLLHGQSNLNAVEKIFRAFAFDAWIRRFGIV